MSYERLNLNPNDTWKADHVRHIEDGIESKQDALVSGTNIKSINGNSILGNGEVEIQGATVVFYSTDYGYKKYTLSGNMWEYKQGYFWSGTGWTANDQYHSYQFMVTDSSMSKLYLEFSSPLSSYLQIVHNSDGGYVRYRTSENNLPEGQSLELDIKEGDVISISLTYVGDISKTKVCIYQLIRTISGGSDYVKRTLSDSIWEYSTGRYWNDGKWIEHESYVSYQTTATADMKKFYLNFLNGTGRPSNYYQVCVDRGQVSTRYRSTDDNLPLTKSSEIELEEGDIITISCIVQSDVSSTIVYFYETKPISPDSPGGGGTVAMCKCQYTNNLTVCAGQGGLHIYLPQSNGYADWQFVHSVRDTSNCDTWRIAMCTMVDNELNHVQAITTEGAEWEMALRIKDRPDFTGGFAHGDEIYSSLITFVDGRYVDITSLTDLTNFNELKIIVNSTCYDPNDSVTIAFYHSKELIWTKDGLTVNQRVEWLNDYDLASCYLAMMPPLKYLNEDNTKIVTDTFYTNTNYIPTTIPTSDNFSVTYKAPVPTKACVFGTSSGITCTMSIPKYVTTYEKGYYFLLTDNSSNNYNKMYFSIAQLGDSVTAGTIWDTTTCYNIQF